ncbi:YybH family protein [Lysobacter solisilvae (ex Woo and Kim 2020)]|uniref:Nuclear transport factor 2 family protein n=1 Tax=Agrilutibacter terrestris TaxID=2865112 RepID=A0A7H0G0C1_9GAMM|nr:nuclear transport factor 2 family protein [Lysobacter terrestris]QNP41737.1 nuclear transport factor 2 family protein [Lysobacter terrestris]
MKTNLALLLAGALLVPPAFAHDPAAPAAPAASVSVDPAAQPALAVVDQFSAALKAVDLARVSELLAEDALILESGGAERSREEYLGHHAKADAEFLKDAHVQVIRRTARSAGSLAWVGTESELHSSKDGKPTTLLSTETMVLKRVGDDWRIVHIHWSSRAKKATAAAQGSQP